MSKRGVDTLLTNYGRPLATGQEVRFLLVKGPNFQPAPDPVNAAAPAEQFPLIAKFTESVVTPKLQQPPWNTARLYQQDVPKAEEDSDEEAESNAKQQQMLKAKKRWRSRRKEVPKRQWILQEQVEFLETMMAKRQRKALPKDALSTRYEGIPEHNPSQYCLLEVPNTTTTTTTPEDAASSMPRIQVTLLPTPNATINFSQPKARKTLSMTEAEQAIEDQRGKMTRFMMHDRQQLLHANKAPTNESRKRLFGRLGAKNGEDDEEDDIMGDLAFRNRKGGGRARKELLNTLGDEGIKVDADGVLGGNNDSEFGRGQRFGHFKAEQDGTANGNADGGGMDGGGDNKMGGDDTGAGGGGAEPATRGNDGLAMADDFYQRDVQAEYEELDYDANEQFDDDDVDVGEREVVVESSGFAEDDDDEDLEDDELNGEKPSGAEGLASLAGFQLLLAKARGEITSEQAAEAAEGAKLKERQHEEYLRKADDRKRKRHEDDDHLTQIMAAAEKSREEAERKRREAEAAESQGQSPSQATKKAKLEDDAGVQIDEHGQRMITLRSVQKEVWLHHGTISMKRLMKIFDIRKKTAADRRNRFLEVVKELCTMSTDGVDGRVLVLKQHYSSMG